MPNTSPLTESQLINLARNALLVAGHEMGAEGEHWPVINATIYQMMRDYEALQVERNLHAELKSHLYSKLAEMGRSAHAMPAEKRQAVAQKLGELEEVCSAFFSDVDYEHMSLADADLPPHLRRMKHLIATLLEDEDDQQTGKKSGEASDAGGLLGSIVAGIVRLTAELRARQEALQEFSLSFSGLMAKLDQQFGKIVSAAREILAAAMPPSKSEPVALAVRAEQKKGFNNHPRPGMG